MTNQIKNYRTKPVIIRAVQWTGDNLCEIFILSNVSRLSHELDTNYLEIPTLEGTLIAKKGDYIIKGIKGEIYLCKPDTFEATYEEVVE